MSKSKGVRDVLQGVGAGSNYFWHRGVDDDPPHGTGNWGVSTQIIHMYHWETDPAVSGRKWVVTNFGGSNMGGGV